MAENKEKIGINMNQVKYIGKVGECPNCGSTSVRFRLPLECYLETENKKLNKVVLDFSRPQYWLKTTVTTCAKCGYQFHLRNHNNEFYMGLEESKNDKGDDYVKWSYKFDDYQSED